MKFWDILRGAKLTDKEIMETAIRIETIDVPSIPPADPEAEIAAFREAREASKSKRRPGGGRR